jgi:methanogenic corrinoid protein MtbC1
MSEKPSELAVLLADLEEEKLLNTVKNRIQENTNPLVILDECREGIRLVGERFEKGDYFVSDLIMSAEIFKGVLGLLEPLMTSGYQGKSAGKMVFGTVKGDIHNIGKDIVISMLRADGFEVIDLGVDVPEEQFVSKVRETGATMVGLSGLLTIAYDSMKSTVDALVQAGLRKRVQVMVGGSMMNDSVCAYIGADAWGNNVASAMTLARKFAKAA